jgi:hypothetical protein
MATGSPLRFRILARVGGRGAAASLILLSSAVFAAGPAWAECDVLDPMCVVETVDDTVDSATETIDDTTGEGKETVDGTVDGTLEETVEETTETIDETVESATSQADETVDDTVGSGRGPVDDLIGPSQPILPGADPVPPRTVDPTSPSGDGAGNGGTRNGSGGGSSTGDRLLGTEPGGVAGSFVLDPASSDDAPAVEGAPAPVGFLDELLGPAGEVASRIAFPLGLALLVFLFVSFQNRLDRRDPKLALAATSPDVLRFG